MSSTPSRRPSDGTFSRSVAAAGGRGILLIVLAVLIGALLLHETDDDGGSGATQVTTGTETSVTTGETSATQAGTDTTAAAATGETTQVAPPAPSNPVGTEARPLTEVRVLVVNGRSGIAGVAGATSEQISAAGYTNVLTPADGPAHTKSTVYFAPTFDADCQRLAAFVAQQRQEQLALAPITDTLKQEVADAANADCVVVIAPPATTESSAAA
jgi:hypothetical protein